MLFWIALGLCINFKLILRSVLWIFFLIQKLLEKYRKTVKYYIVCLVFYIFFTMSFKKTPLRFELCFTSPFLSDFFQGLMTAAFESVWNSTFDSHCSLMELTRDLIVEISFPSLHHVSRYSFFCSLLQLIARCLTGQWCRQPMSPSIPLRRR